MEKENCFNPKLTAIYKNINFYRYMVAASSSRCQRLYYERQLFNEIMCLNYWRDYYSQDSNITKRGRENLDFSGKIYTLEELSKYDGSNGKPAYVAVDGKVYDVSNESTWGGGTHFSLYAGKDLTPFFSSCHNGNIKMLKNLPIVGVLYG